MQIVSTGDNLHERSNHVFWGKKKKKRKNITNLSSAELAQNVVNIKESDLETKTASVHHHLLTYITYEQCTAR